MRQPGKDVSYWATLDLLYYVLVVFLLGLNNFASSSQHKHGW